MRRLAAAALAIPVLIASRAIPAQDDPPKNLIVNGSFEEGPDVDDYLSLDLDSVGIKGWTVTRGQIDYSGRHWKAAAGERSLDLNGSPGFGGVKQAFRTTRGRRYRVSFSMAGTPAFFGGDGAVKILCVRAAGKKEAFSADATGKTGDDMGWVRKTWEFTAVEDETTLEFHSLDIDDPNCGPALDDVSVVELREKGGE
jgi:choice-of-anchor C domain-containing protein